MSILELENVTSYYGEVCAIRDITLTIEEGESVAILGANGAGKTTLLKTVAGLKIPQRGRIRYRDCEYTRTQAHTRARNGLVLVPEGRGIFPRLTVEENLKLGGWGAGRAAGNRIDHMLERFPRLRERRRQAAGSLSGGEQQMLCVARALIREPAVVLLDEPSMGLAPAMVAEIYEILWALKDRSVTAIVVEQNVNYALKLATRGYVLVRGEVALTGTSAELADSPEIFETYLGA